MKANFAMTRVEQPVSSLAVYGSVIIPLLIAALLNVPRVAGNFTTYLEVFLNDVILLRLTFAFYLFASICFACYLFQKKDDFAEKFLQVGSFLAVLGFTFHSTSFILRWIDVKRPPVGGINEVVLSFAWALVMLNLLISHASKFRFMNFISMPFATVAALLAMIFPTGREVHLVPALQSYWIFIHVPMAMFAYPTFGLSFLLGVLYLVKDRVRPASFGVAIMGLSALILAVMDHGSLFTGNYGIPGFENGHENPAVSIAIPGVGPIFSLALMAAMASLMLYILTANGKEKAGAWAFRAAQLSLFAQIVGMGLLSYRILTVPGATVAAIPFEITGIGFCIASITFLWFLTIKQETIINLLPDHDKLDTLIYRVITIGFPLLAGQLVTGAMWAGESWGRYWGWDPKETWALITWLIYAAYLHTRITRGWTGRKNVYFAIVGFASVMFTYLGVTYLLSGLHSYK